MLVMEKDTTPSARSSPLPSPGNRVQITVEEEGLEETGEPAHSQSPNKNASNTNTKPNADKHEKGPAPRGECKFDGTDYPDWLPINPFKKAEEPFTFPFPEVEGDPWAKVATKVKDYDDAMCNAWTEEIQNMLLFAGLFSAVVTAFAIETQGMLQPDPAVASVLLLAQLSTQLGNGSGLDFANNIAAPFQNNGSSTQSLRINVLMYFSLVLSLGTALVGIIALQWIRSYRQSEPQSDKDCLILRQSRYDSLMIWKVPQIISALPLVLQASLIIFFAGLIDFLDSLSVIVTIITSSLIGAIILFVSFTTVAPAIPFICNPWVFRRHTEKPPLPHCPYQSPQSWLFVQVLLALKRAGDFVYLKSHYSYDHVEEVQRKLIDAQNWAQLVLVDVNPPSAPKLEPISRSLQWISRTFHNLDSFCTLFHCFQTLDDDEMKDTLLEIHDQSQSDNIKAIIPEDTGRDIPPLEKKHLFSNALLCWGIDQHYWKHPRILSHALELSLRSATYSMGDPSKYPDNRMVMSKLPFWLKFQDKGFYFCSWSKNLEPSDKMWSFAFLLYLQESKTDSHSSPDFKYHPIYSAGIQCLQRLTLGYHFLDVRIFDEILGVLDKWLIAFPTRNVDEDEDANLVEQIIYLASEENEAILNHQIVPILRRPAFLSFLDHLAEHPQGLECWQTHLNDNPSSGLWFKLFVDNFLETRYAAFITGGDEDDVKMLVEERDGQAPEQVEAAENPDIEDNTDKGALDADIADSASNLSRPAALDDSPPGATHPDSITIPTTTITTLPSRPNTITIAPTYTPPVHAAPSYSTAGSDVELGLPISSRSQGAFIEEADDVQDHPSSPPPETLLTVVVHSSTNN